MKSLRRWKRKSLSDRFLIARFWCVRGAMEHPALWMIERFKARRAINIVRIARAQRPFAQSLMLGMIQRKSQHGFADAFPAVGFIYEHIGNPRERRAIGDDAQISNLLIVRICADDE